MTDIVTQHAEEAAFLWLLRDDAARRPDYTSDELAEVDERVEAHLDGLRVRWEACWQQLEAFPESGEVFAAAVLALESRNRGRIQPVVDVAVSDPAGRRGLVAAFGWLPFRRVREQIDVLLQSGEPRARSVGIA